MKPERYERLYELFSAALDLEPGDRSDFLRKACADDAELHDGIESLLARHQDVPTDDASAMAMTLQSPAPQDASPKRIGSYRIIRELGRGGMGVVYLGMRDEDRFKRRVAIKVLKRGLDTEEILGRFDLERQLLAALNHPNIARMYEAGQTEDGLPYFTMEYIEGTPLEKYCDQQRLPIAQRLELFRSVCSAVHYLHKNLVVHRDLKPGNILVTRDGTPKLLDFGIAKLINPELSLIVGDPTAPEVRVMTPEYASPEQVRGDPITTASDIYSLGVILYQLVSGHRPYQLKRHLRAEIERVICEEDPEKPSTAISRIEESDFGDDDPESSSTITPESVSRSRGARPDRLRKRLAGDIDTIVLMAMRKEPWRRYQSAEQLSDDLDKHLHGLPVIARRDTMGYRSSKFVSRHRVGVAVTVVIAGILVSLALFSTRMAQIATQGRDDAIAARAEVESQKAATVVSRARAAKLAEDVQGFVSTVLLNVDKAVRKLDGSLAVRHLIVDAAMGSLEDLVEDMGEDDPRLRSTLANWYDVVGDLKGGIRSESLGDTDGARENYTAAFEIRKELADNDDDPVYQSALATSYIRLGDVDIQIGATSNALESYEQALMILEKVGLDDWRGQHRRTTVLNQIGATLQKRGELESAKHYYEQSLAVAEAAHAKYPAESALHRDVGVVTVRLAYLHQTRGDYDKAVRLYEDNVRIRDALLDAEPDSGRAKRDVALARLFLGDAMLARGDTKGVAPHFRVFLVMCRARSESNPDSVRAERDLVVAYEGMARSQVAAGDWAGAALSYQQTRWRAESLSDTDPANTQYRQLMAQGFEGLGDVERQAGESRAAINHYENAKRILIDLGNRDRANVAWPRALSDVRAKIEAITAGK